MNVADLINELAGLPPMMEILVIGPDGFSSERGPIGQWYFPIEVIVDTGFPSPCAAILTSETMPASKPADGVVDPEHGQR